MLKLVAAVLLFLEGFGVIHSTENVTWWLVALGLGFLGLVFDALIFNPTDRFRRE